jgi:type IV pilus assembly protein PilE
MKRGFTLVELLVCLAIAALLVMVALPSWRAVVLRVQRADATAALHALAAAQERYRLVHGHYASAAAPAPPLGLGLGLSERGWYELRVDQGDATGFRASARAAAGSPQAADAACVVFSIDQAGTRGSAPERPEVCWR